MVFGMEINTANLNQVGYTGLVKTTSEPSIDLNSAAMNTNSVQSSIDMKHKGEIGLSTSEKAIMNAVERANKVRSGDSSHVEYSVHRPHGDIVVKVVNSETKEVIHEYPPEKILDLIDKLQEINGTIVDEKR
jgi:flagellar protein FlaG